MTEFNSIYNILKFCLNLDEANLFGVILMNFNWKEKRSKTAFLALENGEIFKGYSFGANVDKLGETVFNTGMSGYEGIISDPSYAGQFVSLTSPEVGNYGVDLNYLESRSLFLNGLIISNINEPSNYSSQISLQDILKKHNICLLYTSDAADEGMAV